MAQTLLIIFNLFLLESILSIDNAAVLALMVKDLSKSQQPKALRYGLVGAFVFRGASLFLVSWIIKISWLKILGGAYLLYLVWSHFTPKKDSLEEGVDKDRNVIYNKIRKSIGPFWATVALVEVMDMAFSVDNIFAAVAMTDKIYLILIGVFIGILAMRFIAQWFAVLICKYPSLEKSAFIVIGALGIKIITVGIYSTISEESFKSSLFSTHSFEFTFSSLLMIVFFLPIFTKTKEHKDAVHEI